MTLTTNDNGHPGTPTARLCLNMIVRNEAAIIERCLDAAAPWVDHYVICDTGSTDETVALVHATMERHGVPGEIVYIPFVDFSQARNEALEQAQSSEGNFDYILFTDADMTLRVDDPLFRERLTEDVYLVTQRNVLTYANVRLVRRGVSARYVGSTHEYLATDSSGVPLVGIMFDDHANGANRPEKYERDIRLLSADIERDPANARALFYLAQTHKDAGNEAEAIGWYERRIAAGGWAEEVWHSHYMISRCWQRLGETDKFVAASLAAYNNRPGRAEPLYHLAKHYREAGQHEACLAFCEIGLQIPFPTDRLFVEQDVYRFGFQQEVSVSGFYCTSTERKQRAQDACFRLVTDRAVPADWRRLSGRNALFYAPSAAAFLDDVEMVRLEPECAPGYHAMNPSLVVEGGVRCGVVRTVNYIFKDGRYVIDDPNRVVRTNNLWVELTPDYRISQQTLITTGPGVPPANDFAIKGFEDCRPFRWQGRWWMTATMRDRHPTGLCRIGLLELDDSKQVVAVHMQDGPDRDRHEKNWLPVVRGDDLFLVYLADPLTVLRVDPATMQAAVATVTTPPIAMDSFRGSSPLLPFDGGWLYVVHEQIHPNGSAMRYLHRFVRLDADFGFVAASDPFYFREQAVEFCAGLAYDPERDRLAVSFGVRDNEAWLVLVEPEAVRRVLRRRG